MVLLSHTWNGGILDDWNVGFKAQNTNKKKMMQDS
jgi:hypothetical protein